MTRPFRCSTTVLSLFLAALIGCGGDNSPLADTELNRPGETATLRVARIDSDIPTVGVDRLLRNPQDLSGRVAVQGVVVQSFQNRGAFVVVDIEEFGTCGLHACTDATLPIRITSEQYEGTFPNPAERVTLIGDFESLERGFRFDLHEVHRDGSVILARVGDREE